MIETGVTIGSSGTPCVLTFASNTKLEMQGTAFLWGRYIINTAISNVEITGGEANVGTVFSTVNGDDVLVEQGVYTSTSGPVFYVGNSGGGPTARVSIVSNEISAGSYAVLADPGAVPNHVDLMVVNNDITCATATDEACVRVQDGDGVTYLANRAFNTVGLKSCFRMYDGSVNALMAGNVCVNVNGLAAFEIYSTGEVGGPTDHRGDIDNVHILNNRHFYSGTWSGVTSVFGGQAAGSGGPGPYTCGDFFSSGNQLISSNDATYVESVASCSGYTEDTSGDRDLDLDDAPYNGSPPDCSTLGCGPS
ncbi:MAG: hypothetical protein NXI30_04540 [bacterium]|nr:hypothetical protein [bacterium]